MHGDPQSCLLYRDSSVQEHSDGLRSESSGILVTAEANILVVSVGRNCLLSHSSTSRLRAATSLELRNPGPVQVQPAWAQDDVDRGMRSE